MKLTLKAFQSDAVDDLRKRARQSSNEILDDGDEQALLLNAPTGSGKTAMATAFMERLVNGDEDHPPDPNATFLWITDQPDLNEQTKRKLQVSSDVFSTDDELVTIEAATFDQDVLAPGVVYFLNTQKLMKTSRLVGPKGDKRDYTLWETIANTVAARPGSFWLVIDEAHRGMGKSQNEVNDARTIIQKFIVGSDEDGLPKIPLIFGISATPKPFNELLEGVSGRVRRDVSVDPEDVRESGLLKDSIVLFHSGDDQPADITMLGAAAERLVEFEKQWKVHKAKNEGQALVRPIMVAQVADASGKKLSATDLKAAVEIVTDKLGVSNPNELAHSFEEHTTLTLGGKSVRYLAPADIEADANVRAVFFKRSLTTGWDCPRAEVLMSFRKTSDEVLIAQLVGRMVRTPLAQSTRGNDLLNSVNLFLPEYDSKTVKAVIKRLSEADPDNGLAGGGDGVKDGNEIALLKRAKGTKTIFDSADGVPMYKVERVPKINGVKRLLRLGRALGNDKIDEDAFDNYEKALLDLLEAERAVRAGKKAFKEKLKEAATIQVGEEWVQLGATESTSGSGLTLQVAERNIDQAFAAAGRKLGEGLHKAYMKSRHAVGGLTLSGVKCEIYVLAMEDTVREALEIKAHELCDTELEKHDIAWKALADERVSIYRQLRQQGSEPKPEPWRSPDTIEGPSSGDEWTKHVYVKDDGTFTTSKLTKLERLVLAEEMARDDFIGFLRNEDRKEWSFSVNYKRQGAQTNMFPDFLIFRKKDGSVVVDILEPHTQSQSDSADKARGLAEFAEKHLAAFGRIELLDKVGDKVKRLRLHEPATCTNVKAVANDAHLMQLFKSAS